VLGVHLVFEDVTEQHELRNRLDSLDRELTSAYEELQRSNEELETMNEELQSTNEELQTLNDELRDRTREVDRVNGFLHGILAGPGLGVLVVDTDLLVQLWNESAEQMTGLRGFEAQGRRLTDLPLGLPVEDLARRLADAVHGRQPTGGFEVALTDRFGHDRRRRLTVSALRRVDADQVMGAVVTLADVPAPAADVIPA
jgi:two-component system, chemotaxis family, CheB/CheR fusion protein